MGKGKQYSGNQQADTHHHSTYMLVGIECFYAVFETKTYDAYGNHRDNDVKCILCLAVPFKLEHALQYPRNFLEQDCYCC